MRKHLATVGYELFQQQGFDNVTIDDLTEAAGVSRTTFFRYFDNKEEVVLGSWDLQSRLIIDGLLARPADEDEWTSLRRGLDQTLESYRTKPDDLLTLFRFIRETPALWGGLLKKQSDWLPTAATALAARRNPSRPPTLGDSVLVSAAVGCYNVALGHWVASDGQLDFEEVLDEAFATLAPSARAGRRSRER